MKLRMLLSGVSLGVLTLALGAPLARAQEQLPEIDVGAARPVSGGDNGPSLGGGAPGPGSADNGQGYGGAGVAQDPYNQSYVLPDASTGTKMDTPVMDTPLNVQSVSQQVLRDQQVTTLAQAVQNFPNVTVVDGAQGGGGLAPAGGILVRGFLTSTYYVDGFRQDAGYDNISTRQFANIQSVELLAGPGAILYGFVDPGGIINVVTKEPLKEPYYAVQQQVGSLADYRTLIDTTGPLNADKSLLYRFNMSYENNGAPYGSLIDTTHSQDFFVAPVVKWEIDGSTWVKLEGEYNQSNLKMAGLYTPMLNNIFINVPRNMNWALGQSLNNTDTAASLTWGHQFDKDWSIRQRVAYYQDAYANVGGNAFTPTFVGNNIPALSGYSYQLSSPRTTWSTDVDIKGHINTLGAEHAMLLGGDYYWGNQNGTGITTGTTFNYIFNPMHLGTPNPTFPFLASYDVYRNTQTTAGLYLQDQVKLPHDFFLLAGARYQYVGYTSLGGAGPYSMTNNGLPTSDQALTPRFGLLWRPQEWLSLYGNYSQNFGPNNGAFIYPGVPAPPTSAESWEGGVKLEFFNGKLRATADYFDLVKTNVPFQDPNPAHNCGTGPGSCSIIAGAVRSTGPEVSVQGEVYPGLSVIATYGNDDARVTKAQPGVQPAVGQRFVNVPRNQAGLSTTYEFQHDFWLKGLKLGAGWNYTGSKPQYTGSYPASAFPLVPAVGLVDLMAAYSFNYSGSKSLLSSTSPISSTRPIIRAIRRSTRWLPERRRASAPMARPSRSWARCEPNSTRERRLPPGCCPP